MSMIAGEQRDTHGVVVICTKDRPREVERCCMTAHTASPNIPILVLDASTAGSTRHACESIACRYKSSLNLIYRRAQQPGLARQRNEAVGICRELGVEVLHFIDDDTEVSHEYFDAIERRFCQEPTVMGIGGVILNQPSANNFTIKRAFLLQSRRRGYVLRSGRNTVGQYPGARAADRVDWLSGCSMSYRIAVFDKAMFDDRLKGYSLGEDLDFGFRLSRGHLLVLVVEPSATCIHHLTPTARDSMRAIARQGTQSAQRWVSENRGLGLSRTAFWWATLGEILLHTARWILSDDTDALQQTLGILDGVVAIIRKSFPLSIRQRPGAVKGL